MGGRLLRPGGEDRGDHPDLAVGRSLGGAGRLSRHAVRTNLSRAGDPWRLLMRLQASIERNHEILERLAR